MKHEDKEFLRTLDERLERLERAMKAASAAVEERAGEVVDHGGVYASDNVARDSSVNDKEGEAGEMPEARDE